MPNLVIRATPILAFVLFGVGAWAYFPFVADDAHIVGRYALNAADGLGLVYNAGERVSALTSPLHALVVTGLAFVTDDPVTLYRGLAPLLPLLALLGALKGARLGPGETALICAFGLASPFLALWSIGGLETPILAALMTLYAARLLRVYRAASFDLRDTVALGALTGLAFLTRHDSILVTLPPLLALTSVYWRWPAVWAGAGVALVLAGSWLSFAYLYYGDILPTSFYTKMVTDRIDDTVSLVATLNFFLISGLVLCLPFLRFVRMPGHPFGRVLILGVLVSVTGFTLFCMKNAGMHMMFGYRYFVPFLPAIGILLAAAMARVPPLLPPVLLVGQGALALFVHGQSINPHLFERIGPMTGHFEYERMRPVDYGRFITTLQGDAADIRAHWQATGRTGQPVIGMHTGGMGYWLREFRVIEILVSYRHDCRMSYEEIVAIPDYIQGINFVRQANRLRTTFLNTAENPETLSLSAFEAGHSWVIDYAYRTNGQFYPYPAQTHGPCVEPGPRQTAQN